MERLTSSTPQVASPTAKFIGRWAIETGLSVGTGIAADQIQKSLLKKGEVPAALIAVGAAAGLKAVAKGVIAVVDNQVHHRDWSQDVTDEMATGFRTGLIDASHSLIAPHAAKYLGGRLAKLPAAAQTALTGSVLWSVNGAVTVATDSETWQHGARQGMKKVLQGAGTGAVTGTITGPLGAP